MCLNIHKPNCEKEQNKFCDTLVKNINSPFTAFTHSYYLQEKKFNNYNVWILDEHKNERIEDNKLITLFSISAYILKPTLQ